MIELSWHSHIPDPRYLELLKDNAIFLDVNTLLRGLLFPASHSARLLEHVERSGGAKGVVCPHVRNKAVHILKEYYPALIEKFTANYLLSIKRGVIESVEDGDPSGLPSDVRFDPLDDDIVIASAAKAKCDFIATLDHKLAEHASQIIDILPPSQPECSTFIPTLTSLDDTVVYAGPESGSIIVEIAAQEHSTKHSSPRSKRRYVICSENGLACWLNEKNWKYQIGFADRSTPLATFPHVDPEQPALLAISYDCSKKLLCAGIRHSAIAKAQIMVMKVGKFEMPSGAGRSFSFLSRGDSGQFNGYLRGLLTTAKFVGESALNYSLRNKSHFQPLDCQLYPLSNGTFEPVLLVTPEPTIHVPF